jgi:hypothetical protein
MCSSGWRGPLPRPPEPRHPERCAAQHHATALATSPARSCRRCVPHAWRSRPLQACINNKCVRHGEHSHSMAAEHTTVHDSSGHTSKEK